MGKNIFISILGVIGFLVATAGGQALLVGTADESKRLISIILLTGGIIELTVVICTAIMIDILEDKNS